MAGPRRIVVPGRLVARTTPTALDEATSHYLGRVLRLVDGTTLEVLDQAGTLWSATVRFDRRGARLEDLTPVAQAAPGRRLWVGVSVFKAQRMEWAIEKAGELGATDLVPVLAARSVVKVDEASRKVERWQRIADEATQQCARPDRVTVHSPLDLAGALAAWAPATTLFFDEQATDHAWPDASAGDLALLFGPEGGFTESERAQVLESGAHRVGLGPSLLRAETAIVCALSGLRLRQERLI